MKDLKVFLFFLCVFFCQDGFSAVYICGMHTNHATGVSTKVCHTFFNHKCNEGGDFLAGVANIFPGGWTCYEGIAQKEGHNVHLISGDNGTFVFVGSESIQITSDAFLEFLQKLHQDTANMRVSDQMIQDQIDAFLDTDSGKVSDARLKQLSLDLGVPIEYEGSGSSGYELRKPGVTPKTTPKPTSTGRPGWEPHVPASGQLAVGGPGGNGGHPNPTVPPGTGQPAGRSADSGSQQTRIAVKIPADSCSLPECACRVVSTSGDSLCEGGIEGETEAGKHFCKCGRFGPQAVQSGGGGGEFTAGDVSSTGPSAREPHGVSAPPSGGQQGAVVPVEPHSKNAPILTNLQRRGVVMSDSMQRLVFTPDNSRSMTSYGLTKMTRDLNENDLVYFVNPVSYGLSFSGKTVHSKIYNIWEVVSTDHGILIALPIPDGASYGRRPEICECDSEGHEGTCLTEKFCAYPLPTDKGCFNEMDSYDDPSTYEYLLQIMNCAKPKTVDMSVFDVNTVDSFSAQLDGQNAAIFIRGEMNSRPVARAFWPSVYVPGVGCFLEGNFDVNMADKRTAEARIRNILRANALTGGFEFGIKEKGIK